MYLCVSICMLVGTRTELEEGIGYPSLSLYPFSLKAGSLLETRTPVSPVMLGASNPRNPPVSTRLSAGVIGVLHWGVWRGTVSLLCGCWGLNSNLHYCVTSAINYMSPATPRILIYSLTILYIYTIHFYHIHFPPLLLGPSP